MISWLLFGAEDVLNSGESEYWPNRSFPGILFLTSFLAIANSLKLFHFKILFQKIYFPIKQVHFSHLPLFFLKSRHAVKHFNQINVFPSFFFFKKRCQFVFHFLCLSVTTTPIPLAAGLPLSTIFNLHVPPLHIIPNTAFKSFSINLDISSLLISFNCISHRSIIFLSKSFIFLFLWESNRWCQIIWKH